MAIGIGSGWEESSCECYMQIGHLERRIRKLVEERNDLSKKFVDMKTYAEHLESRLEHLQESSNKVYQKD